MLSKTVGAKRFVGFAVRVGVRTTAENTADRLGTVRFDVPKFVAVEAANYCFFKWQTLIIMPQDVDTLLSEYICRLGISFYADYWKWMVVLF